MADLADNPRDYERAQQEALNASRLESLKQPAQPQSATTTKMAEAPATEIETETQLGEQKNLNQNKLNSADPAESALIATAKSELKRRAVVWFLPALGTILFWAIIVFFIALMLFAGASVYLCAEEKGWSGLSWEFTFGEGFTGLLEDSFSGSCGVNTRTNNEDTAASESAETQNIPADTTAQNTE